MFLSCEAPAAVARQGRRGSHTTARELQTCTFQGTGDSNTTKIPRKDPQREKEERKLGREEEKKSAKFSAPHPSGLHPSGPPPFGAFTLRGLHPSRPPPSGLHTSGLHPSGPHPSKAPHFVRPKIQNPKIGRNRNWPKSKLAEVEIGRSRKWPKSIALTGRGGARRSPPPPRSPLRPPSKNNIVRVCLFRRFQEVSGGFRRFQEVSGGFRRFSVQGSGFKVSGLGVLAFSFFVFFLGRRGGVGFFLSFFLFVFGVLVVLGVWGVFFCVCVFWGGCGFLFFLGWFWVFFFSERGFLGVWERGGGEGGGGGSLPPPLSSSLPSPPSPPSLSPLPLLSLPHSPSLPLSLSSSLFGSKIIFLLFFTLTNCQTGNFSSFSHSLTTAAFASRIFIAQDMEELCAPIYSDLKQCPLSPRCNLHDFLVELIPHAYSCLHFHGACMLYLVDFVGVFVLACSLQCNSAQSFG